jgi:hypothetical protein
MRNGRRSGIPALLVNQGMVRSLHPVSQPVKQKPFPIPVGGRSYIKVRGIRFEV